MYLSLIKFQHGITPFKSFILNVLVYKQNCIKFTHQQKITTLVKSDKTNNRMLDSIQNYMFTLF